MGQMKYLPRVLIVDDETDFLQLMTVVLRSNGFDVYSIANGKNVFSTIRSCKPDIILLDVKLGNHDGREICKELKSNSETKHIKVLLHSAFSHVAWEYQNCGADGFLLKPDHIPDLLHKMKSLLPHYFD
jgi:DNA-binding response OmpR family regulator